MQRKNWVIPGFLVLAILLLLSFPALASADDNLPAGQAQSQPAVGDNSQTAGPVPEQQKDDKAAAPVLETTPPDSGAETATTPEQSTVQASDSGQVDSSKPATTPETPAASDPGQVDSSKPATTPETPAASDPDQVDSSKPATTPETPAASDPGQVDSSKPATTPETPAASDPGPVDSSKPATTPETPAASDPGQVDSSKPATTPETPAVSDPGQVDSSKPATTPETPAASDPDQVDSSKPATTPETPAASDPGQVDSSTPATTPETPAASDPGQVDSSKPATTPETPAVSDPGQVDSSKPATTPETPAASDPGQVNGGNPVLQPVESEQNAPVSSPEAPVTVPDIQQDEVQPAPVIVVPNPAQQDSASDIPAVVVNPQTGEYSPGYTVKPGDSLQTISQKTGVSVEDLKKANGLDVPDDTVAVPPTSSESTDNSADKAGNGKEESTISYKVREGESLWLIGMKLGVPWQEIMAANNLSDYLIYPEQELVIPGIKLQGGMLKYRIREGDTLYLIGRALGLDYEDIMSLNGLKDFWIYPDHELVIPDKNSVSLYKVKKGETLTDIARRFNLGKNDIYGDQISGNALVEGQVLVIPQTASTEASGNMQVSSAADLSSASDLELLARAIYAEARGEVYEGKVAVGAVILNRLKDPAFPKTIRDIIFQPLAFTSVADGQINLTPDQESYKAAKEALSGSDPSLGALYYWNPNVATSKWIWTRPIIKQIGGHVFAR